MITAPARVRPVRLAPDDAPAPACAAAGAVEVREVRAGVLAAAVAELVAAGELPSFCTACARRGRPPASVGAAAAPDFILRHCIPNALVSFQQHLCLRAGPGLRHQGECLIARELCRLPRRHQGAVRARLAAIRGGACDLLS
jgi:2-iminoacetate synthase